MNTKIQGIYKIRNCINGKIYIGQSIDIEYRFYCHKYNIKLNYKHFLYNAFRKYGVHNFEFTIIELVTDSLKLDEREQYWMDHYQCYNPEFGYNICKEASTMRGFKCSDESKLKISKANKGKKRSEETRLKLSLALKGKVSRNKGKKHSDEARLKMSLVKIGKVTWNKGKIGWNKGKKLSDETKRKMSLAKKGKTSNRKGKKASEETIKRMSMANKGRPHKKGYKLSDETKRKLSESHKGQIPWIKGRKHSEVTKLKMSLSRKGKKYFIKTTKKLLQADKENTNNLIRKRLTIEDIQKLQQSNVIIFRKAN